LKLGGLSERGEAVTDAQKFADPLPQTALMNPSVLDETMPREDIGQCIAFEIKARASLCLVTTSIREIVLGDHAEIRALGNARRAAR